MTGGRTVALLVAAGSGRRLGAPVPKGFVTLRGRPLLVHAAGALLGTPAVDDLVVVTGAGEVERAAKVLAEFGVAVRAVVAGGAERHESVALGLEALRSGDAVVAVHDAARPLVTPGLVASTVAALAPPWVAVAPAMRVVDTLKLAGDDGRVIRTVERSGLWAVQTPQVFPADVLRRAHARAGTADVTDDLALVERAGGRVRLVQGERLNIKVTYPDDLALAEAVLAQRERA